MHRTHALLLVVVFTLAALAVAPIDPALAGNQCTPALEGVVTGISLVTSTFTIRLGADPSATAVVWVQSTTEVWLMGAAARRASLADIDVGDTVAADGFCLDDGRMLAMRIRLRKAAVAGAPADRAATLPGQQPPAHPPSGQPPATLLPPLPPGLPSLEEIQLDGMITAKTGGLITLLGENGSTIRLVLTGETRFAGIRTAPAQLASGDIIRIRARVGASGMFLANAIETLLTVDGKLVAAANLRLAGVVLGPVRGGQFAVRIRNGATIQVALAPGAIIGGLRKTGAEIALNDVLSLEGRVENGRLLATQIRVVMTADGRVKGTVTAIKVLADGSVMVILDGLVAVRIDAGLAARIELGQTIAATGQRASTSPGVSGVVAGVEAPNLQLPIQP